MRFSLPALVLFLSVVNASPLPKNEKAAAASSSVISSASAAASSSVMLSASAAASSSVMSSASAAASSSAIASATGTAAASSSVISSATGSSTAAATSAASSSNSTASAGSVLTSSAYNDFQISAGTAGSAKDEANALFTGIDMNNLAAVSAADLKIIQGVHDAAEDAEVDGFNPAIAAATGDAATALQNGKIKNKVLKLTAEVLSLQIKVAQGKTADPAPEQKKLANNIRLDTAAAGQASTPVSFDATS
ncbi:uncharacterized protein EAF01_002909 [Botrytis porri]|uniref:Small secreted protein n=1 Tax=Botrytis porri TaxID=87229 RepID=A0A4Z1KC71_9HELO|nr:uncharacterized protein EAF01_002909 [Botrytis porri]KAF7911402.1 hypothetical protein EAF01_002909 [Botrytis porri]TGO83793.1 hypothetical protein BPOR_0592g00030 [Botrytis porri]